MKEKEEDSMAICGVIANSFVDRVFTALLHRAVVKAVPSFSIQSTLMTAEVSVLYKAKDSDVRQDDNMLSR